LTGDEALILQGIPIDEINMTRLKNSQKQDLAGNAMSTTTVGAMIVASMITFGCYLPGGDVDAMDTSQVLPLSSTEFSTDANLESWCFDSTAYEACSVGTVIAAADKTLRMCSCEGREKVTGNPIQECLLCAHTSCLPCGGNPMHQYKLVERDVVAQRALPLKFVDMVKEALPMKIKLTGMSENQLTQLKRTYIRDIDQTSWKITVEAISEAFASELRYLSAKRAKSWTISYESEHARLELDVQTDKLEWRLFAKALATEPANSRVRTLLSRPIARMVPTDLDITKGTWQFWLPKVYKFTASMRGYGGFIPSYQATLGLEKFAGTVVWKKYSVSVDQNVLSRLEADITGKYKLLQQCSTANASLHVQMSDAGGSSPLFLFLDPHLIHDPKHDYFVFSHDNRRLVDGEFRPRVARMDPTWRPQVFEKFEEPDGSAKYRVYGTTTEFISEAEAQESVEVSSYVDGRWVEIPNVQIGSLGIQNGTVHRASADLVVLPCNGSCRKTHVVLNYEATLNLSEHSISQEKEWQEVPQSERNGFFQKFAWLFAKSPASPHIGSREEYLKHSSSLRCSGCAPSPPNIKWKYKPIFPKPTKVKVAETQEEECNASSAEDDAFAAGQVIPQNDEDDGDLSEPEGDTVAVEQIVPENEEDGSDLAPPEDGTAAVEQTVPLKFKVVPFEDPQDTAAFERSLKARPSPLVLSTHMGLSGNEDLKLGVNPSTLMHRAEAKLLLPSERANEIRLSWDLFTNYSAPPDILLPSFTLKSNDSDNMAPKPAGFKFDLREEQARSLGWMVQQENEPQFFDEEEVEEATIPQIGWRAVGTARMKVEVCGGVLADQIGYGKTVTTLALIDTQHTRDLDEPGNATIKHATHGRILLKATLILVPAHLTTQWQREVGKFLYAHRGYNVLTIKDMDQLQDMTIAQFESADIIIASYKLCGGDNYLGKVAQFAGITELPPNVGGRATEAWYEHALMQVAEHVNDLKAGGIGLDKKITAKLAESDRNAMNAETYVPSKRLRGAKYQESKLSKQQITQHTAAESAATLAGRLEVREARKDIFGLGNIAKKKTKWKNMKCPLLELFQFRRLVVDEFTYLKGQDFTTITKLRAKYRWILSGTPPLRDFTDVKRIAKFLGVNLGIDDAGSGAINASNVKLIEKELTGMSAPWIHILGWKLTRSRI
jgi:hypothetical protein